MKQLLDPSAVPAWHRRILQKQCGGDWGRVTDDGAGNYRVHNSPARARAWVGEVPSTPAEAEREKKATQPGRALTALVGVESPRRIRPEVNVVSAVRSPEEEQQRMRVLTWTKKFDGEPDWSKFDVMASASEIFETVRGGLPRVFQIGYHPEVLGLAGLDITQVETAVRSPQFCEIRPESKDKSYPILGFRRGDVFVILGMRTPTRPIVIAAYWSALLEPDRHTVNYAGSAGGGGAKRQAGLPATVRALVGSLTARGLYVPPDWDTTDEKSVNAIYHGQDLGKITVRGATKSTVQSDYQRLLRKMHAIDRREGIAS